MSTRTIHQRSQHRSRFRRLALPAAVVFGVTLAAQCSSLFETTFQSLARAEGPSLTSRKVEPRIVDFTKLAKLKAEARKLLDAARKAAAKGDVDAARRLADQAAAVPVEWNLSETSPKKFLAELAADPEKFTGSTSPSAATDREVIELPLPNDRKGGPKNLEDDLPAEDTSTNSSVKTVVTAPPRSAKSTTSKSLQSLGFKTAAATPITPETNESVPPTSPRLAPIPSLEELADTTANQSAPTTTTRSTAQASNESPLPNPSRGRVSTSGTASKNQTRTRQEDVTAHFESQTIRQLANDDSTIPAGRIEHSQSSAPFSGLRSQSHGSEVTCPTTSATTTTVIHEIRVTDRPAPVDQTASLNSSSASQLLMNLNSLMMAGLFGALVLLIVIAVAVLRKFGPNPQFTFKVELNQPLGVAATAVAAAEPIVKAAIPPVQVSPIYALKRQMEEELGQQQEDAMMRQVFEDNLKLREQIEETRIAA